jgi:hypothetical protein
MRKYIAGIVCALFLLGIAVGPSFAKEAKSCAKTDSVEKIGGTISSIDTAKSMVTIKDEAGTERTFTVTAAA